ncbi:hypothetical protein AB8881_05220 [Alphaproteobacteria bacterium LSUCC0396]
MKQIELAFQALPQSVRLQASLFYRDQRQVDSLSAHQTAVPDKHHSSHKLPAEPSLNRYQLPQFDLLAAQHPDQQHARAVQAISYFVV